MAGVMLWREEAKWACEWGVWRAFRQALRGVLLHPSL